MAGPLDDTATRELLVGQARGRFGKLDPARVAAIVMQVTAGHGFAIQKAAFDALVRRYGFARRDALQPRPPAKGILGDYTTEGTKGKKAGERPYVTRLASIAPLVASCSCRDFLRSGLGVCKHVLVVLESLEVSGAIGSHVAPHELDAPDLAWDPYVPLAGARDRLARLTSRTSLPGFVEGSPSSEALADPAARLRLVTDLEAMIRANTMTAEPAALALVVEERTRAERRLEASAAAENDFASRTSLLRELYTYQAEGLRAFLETGRLLLADDMGLGKTTQAIAACHALFATKRIRRALLVVPAALRGQWKREWDATTDAMPLTVVEGSPEERARLYRKVKSGALVMGYEQLLRDLAHVKTFDPEMFVLDEAQRVKNWATKSALCVAELGSRYRLVLTGTPMENRIDELGALVDLVDDVALEPKWRLAAEHVVRSEGPGPNAAPTAVLKGLGGLRTRLSSVLLRRVRHDVLSDLPPRTDTRVPVELSAEQRAEHDELLLPISQLLALSARRSLAPGESTRLMSLLAMQRMIGNGLAQVRFAETWPRIEHQKPSEDVLAGLFSPKLSAFRGLVERVVVEQSRKAVVFSQWRAMLSLSEWAVRDKLAEHGLRAAFFTGAESKKERERAVRDLAEDPTLAVLFLSDAGGVGLNLQHAASVCVNLELPWNPAVLEQRIARIYRLGQTQPIDVFNLVTEEGIEGRIAGLIERKKAIFSAIFDDSGEEITIDAAGGFLDAVRTLVDPIAVAPSELPETVDAPPAASPAPAPAPTPALVMPRIAGLTTKVLADGRVKIEATRELAPRLALLLAELARSLES